VMSRPAAADISRWLHIAPIRALIGHTRPRTAGIDLQLPLVWEDGAAVPVTVAVASEPPGARGILSIHLFATRNPLPEIVAFRFTSHSGRAEASTRIRLNESQTVIAIAEAANGERIVTTHDIRITRSGCLMRTGTDDSGNEMTNRVRVAREIRAGVPAEVVSMIHHPMETGLRPDASGAIPPKRLIRSLVAELAGRRVFVAEMYRAVSANPYVRFFVAAEKPGELSLTWTEDTDRSVQASVAVEVR